MIVDCHNFEENTSTALTGREATPEVEENRDILSNWNKHVFKSYIKPTQQNRTSGKQLQDTSEVSKAIVNKIICSNGKIFEMPMRLDGPNRRRLNEPVEEFDTEPLNIELEHEGKNLLSDECPDDELPDIPAFKQTMELSRSTEHSPELSRKLAASFNASQTITLVSAFSPRAEKISEEIQTTKNDELKNIEDPDLTV